MPWHDVTFDLAFANGAVLLAGIVLYALLGGADFGGGIWDLLARGPRADQQRQEIARAIGPIWEANHVWLIFALVAAFTGLPEGLRDRLHRPLHPALAGPARASSCAARPSSSGPTRTTSRSRSRAGAAVFAIASTATPVFLGMCAGAVASGKIRVVDGNFEGSYWTTWLSPFPIVIGLLSLTTCAYLAAVYLTIEARGKGELEEDFRRRALGAGAVFTVLSLIALAPGAGATRPKSGDGMTDREVWTVVPIGIALAVVSGWAVWTRRYGLARAAAVVEVAVLIVGLGAGPVPVPGRAGPDLREHSRIRPDAQGLPDRLRDRRAVPGSLARAPLRPLQRRKPGHHGRVRRLDKRAGLRVEGRW